MIYVLHREIIPNLFISNKENFNSITEMLIIIECFYIPCLNKFCEYKRTIFNGYEYIIDIYE